jgi:hypothetical protein
MTGCTIGIKVLTFEFKGSQVVAESGSCLRKFPAFCGMTIGTTKRQLIAVRTLLGTYNAKNHSH